MSAPKEGMHLAKEAQELTEKMQDGVVTGLPDTEGVQGGAQATQFQRKFLARDPHDDIMNRKLQLMDDEGMTPFGQVYFSDRDARWMERKAAVSEAANFDAWFNAGFNKNDLASRQFAQQINPEFYAAREREMAARAEVALKLKKIQLRGPQSEDDARMLYLIDSGRVVLPADWDRIGPAFTGSERDLERQQSSTYPAGLIRFPLFLTNRQRASRVGQNLRVGAWGDARAARNVFSDGQPNAGADVRNGPLARGNGRNDTLAKGFESFLSSNQGFQ